MVLERVVDDVMGVENTYRMAYNFIRSSYTKLEQPGDLTPRMRPNLKKTHGSWAEIDEHKLSAILECNFLPFS